MLEQVSDDKFFLEARKLLDTSTCLKTKTAAVIVKDNIIISYGSNMCAPNETLYGELPLECPRMLISTGTNYELCKPIHAEVAACLNIRHDRDIFDLKKFASNKYYDSQQINTAFTQEELAKLNGATIYLVGHYWACENCLNFAKTLGIQDVKFDPLTSEVTRSRYNQKTLKY